jgi:lipoprotein NlpD
VFSLKAIKDTVTLISVLLVICTLISCGGSSVHAPVYNNHLPTKSTSSKVHIVRAGDTLYSIAWQNGKDYRTLAQWNNISWPYTIYKGQKLTLIGSNLKTNDKNKSLKPATKTLKKQKITKSTSNNYQKRLKLNWQWPINVASFEKGLVKSGLVLFGKTGEQVKASESGKVVYAGSGLKGYGNLIIVKHNEEYLTAYGYNKRVLVSEGSVVKKGEVIAEIGVDNKNRRVLFFEMRRHGKAVSILEYMPVLRK